MEEKEMSELKFFLAKYISISGDGQGATWEELAKIDMAEREIKKWALGLLPSKEDADPKQLDYAWQRGRNCVIDYIRKKIGEVKEMKKELEDKINYLYTREKTRDILERLAIMHNLASSQETRSNIIHSIFKLLDINDEHILKEEEMNDELKEILKEHFWDFEELDEVKEKIKKWAKGKKVGMKPLTKF